MRNEHLWLVAFLLLICVAVELGIFTADVMASATYEGSHRPVRMAVIDR